MNICFAITAMNIFANNPKGWARLTEQVHSALEQGEKRLFLISSHDISGWRDFLGQDAGGVYR